MKQSVRSICILVFSSSCLLGGTQAAAQISLGSAQTFGVLGGSTVSNTGATTVTGDVGVSPGSSVTGFPPGVVAGGTIHAADATAAQAQSDLTVAYNDIAGTACNVDLTGQNLGGLTLTPGVYCFSSSAFLIGTLTLDMQGNPNALFIFKIGSTLITGSGAAVVLANSGGTDCPANVFWQVGSSATLGTGTSFAGNILALTSITLNTGAQLNGRALARNGAVTLDTSSVTRCGAAVACPVITVNPLTLPNATTGAPYSATVTASGGTGPYSFSVTSGALPTGILLNGANGDLTGTPTAVGTYDFTITATDASTGCLGSRAYSITVVQPGCAVITLSPSTLPAGAVGVTYSQTVTASGGTAPYTYLVSAGALPAGLALNGATGAITGQPAVAGVFNFTIQATDASSCAAARPYSISITSVAPIPTAGFNAMVALFTLLGVSALFVMRRF